MSKECETHTIGIYLGDGENKPIFVDEQMRSDWVFKRKQTPYWYPDGYEEFDYCPKCGTQL